MRETESGFAAYRSLYENDGHIQSLEPMGIFDYDAFAAAMHDNRTTSLALRGEGQAGAVVPLLTPLEHVSWFNLAYYRRHAGPGAELLYYSHLSQALERDPESYVAALAPAFDRLAARSGIIALDYPEQVGGRIERELAEMAGRLAVTFSTVDGPEGPVTRHYQYAGLPLLDPTGGTIQASGDIHDLYDAYAELRRNDEVARMADNGSVSVLPVLPEEDIEQLWSFYKPVFDNLTENDTINAGLTRDEFTDVMTSPDCAKFIYKVAGDIANACFLMDVRGAPWMNQYYFQQHYPDLYQQGRVLTSPGVIANPNLGRAATSLRTMGMAAKLIQRSGIAPVISFVCDTESNKNVPGLTHYSLNRAGMRYNFTQPVGHHFFRMYRVGPTAHR